MGSLGEGYVSGRSAFLCSKGDLELGMCVLHTQKVSSFSPLNDPDFRISPLLCLDNSFIILGSWEGIGKVSLETTLFWKKIKYLTTY